MSEEGWAASLCPHSGCPECGAKTVEILDLNLKCADLCHKCADLLDRMEALRRERDEAVAHYRASEVDYDNLVALLKKRFPPHPGGTLPSFKVEDVLVENDTLKAKLRRAREALEDMRWRLKMVNGVRVVDLDMVAEMARKTLADLDEGGDSDA